MDGGRTTQTRLFPTGRGQSDTHATILHDGKPNRTPQAGSLTTRSTTSASSG